MTAAARWPPAAVVVAVGVTCALHIGKLPAAIPTLRDALGVSLLQAGFLLSLVQLAGMLAGVFVGLAADRIGPRRVMTAGLCLLGLGSAAGALSMHPGHLLLSRALEGVGFLLAVLPAPGLIRRSVHEPRSLSRALGWWGAYMPLGTALALLLVTPAIAAVGWRPVWLALAMLSVAGALALRAFTAPDVPVASMADAPRRLARTLTHRGPWLVAIGFLCYSGQWLAVIGFLPTLAIQAGQTGVAVGVLSAAVALVNMAGNIGAGRWLARGASPQRVLHTGFAAMGLAAWVAFGAGAPPALQYLAVLVFSGVGGLVPGTLFVLSVRVAPGADTVSTTVGWMQQLSAMGQFAGPPLVAWVATQAGHWHFTWAVTGLASLGGLCIARIIGVRFQ